MISTEKFHNLLQKPDALSSIEANELKELVNEFPYFQASRALYLKKLKQDHSFKYNHNLKVTAAYTSDRSILFDFITSSEFNQNSISEYIKQNIQKLNNIDVSYEDISEKIQQDDKEFSSHLEDNEKVIISDLFEEKVEEKSDNILTDDTKIETQLNLGQPLEFTKNETHSFSEWLSLTQLKPIERTLIDESNEKEKSSKISQKIAKKNKLIEAFIAKNHKLEPKKEIDHKVNIAKARMIPQEELMTETLARIYLEQKNYKKAIQSYKILSLKYPEKSGFFADQIQAVKQLQEKNNTK